MKKICLGWIEHNEVYERLYKGFVTDAERIRTYRNPRVPDSTRWAEQAAASQREDLIPFAVECLWKLSDDWFLEKSWRQVACLKYLLLRGDASVLFPVIEVLEIGPPDIPMEDKEKRYREFRLNGSMLQHAHVVEARIVPLKIELVVKVGDEKTVDFLKTRIEERRKSGLSTTNLEEALNKLQERLETGNKLQGKDK